MRNSGDLILSVFNIAEIDEAIEFKLEPEPPIENIRLQKNKRI